LAPNGGVAISTLIAIGLDGQYLEIVGAETLAAMGFPIVNVVGRGDGVICAERCPAPVVLVLPERRGALDGRLAHLLMFVEVVGMSVTADGVDKGSADAAFFADVVFNERAGGPPVDAEIIVGTVQGADVVTDGMR